MGTLSVLANKVKKLLSNIYGLKLLTTTPILLNYDNILLKTYFDIAETGNFNLLVIKGKPSIELLLDCWEEIVRRNDKDVGSNKYERTFKMHKAIAKMYFNYLYIRTLLLKLYLEFDATLIEELKKEGYVINKSNYYESIVAALNKTNHVITKLTSKRNELKEIKSNDAKQTKITFNRMIAELSVRLAPTVIHQDITLSLYNEYIKIAKAKKTS